MKGRKALASLRLITAPAIHRVANDSLAARLDQKANLPVGELPGDQGISSLVEFPGGDPLDLCSKTGLIHFSGGSHSGNLRKDGTDDRGNFRFE